MSSWTSTLSMHHRSYTGQWGWYYALEDVLIGISGILGYGRTDHESCGLSEYYYGPVAPLHSVYLPDWNGIFQQGNVLCHKADTVLECFQEYNAESGYLTHWILILWSSSGMSWNNSELKNHDVRISCICMSTAWTSGRICLWPSINDLWHSCQGMVSAVLQSKGEPMHY